jgi:hypothetical protein
MIDMINILVVDDTVALKTTVKKECEGEVQTVPKWMGVSVSSSSTDVDM